MKKLMVLSLVAAASIFLLGQSAEAVGRKGPTSHGSRIVVVDPANPDQTIVLDGGRSHYR